MDSKKIIINADDFGRSVEINDAIIESFRKHVITDTSVMATCKVGLSDLKNKIGSLTDKQVFQHVGCHLCLTLGKPLTQEMNSTKYVKDGEFIDSFKIKKSIFLDKHERNLVYNELQAQIHRIRETLGVNISHIDSHQHVHFGLDLLPIVVKLCKEEKIPYLRIPSNSKGLSLKSKIATWLKISYIKLHGIKTVDFFGAPSQILSSYKKNTGVVEAMVHPMYNSKGEIVNKVRIHEADQCEILELQMSAFEDYKKETYSNLL